MGLKPYDRKISQIFNNISYDVDFYQRDYKWNENLDYKPVSSLLKDIFYRFELEKYNPVQDVTQENINKLEWYYLNSFMTNEINGKKYIVDGQQRLTTLTLINIGLYHLSIKYDLAKHITDTIRNLILGSTEYGETYWMGFKDRKRALSDLVDNNLDFKYKPRNTSEKNIYENYKFIYSELEQRLQTAHKVHTFFSYFNGRVFLIEILIDKDKDVAMIFEVINDRGIPLKPYEILKGKLISQIDIKDRDKYIDIWEEQISKLEKFGEKEIDEFFGYYFRSKYADSAEQYRRLDRSRYHKTIFLEEFDQTIGLKNNEKNTRNFIENILPFYVNIYIKLLDCSNSYSKAFEHIYFNRINEQDSQYLLTLSSIRLNDEKEIDKINLLPKYFDRLFVITRLTNSYKSNDFNISIVSLNQIIRDQSINTIEVEFSKILNSIIAKSYDRKDLDEPFKYEFFKNLGYNDFGSSKKFLRYFFARIDHFISDFSDLNEYASYYQLVYQTRGKDCYHIEHIIANNEENIKLFEDEEEYNFQRNRLGALLLLKGKDNESSGKEEYSEKLKTYNVSGTYYAKTLLDDMYHKKKAFIKYIIDNKLNFKPYPKKYAKNEIEERHTLLYDVVKMIWELY